MVCPHLHDTLEPIHKLLLCRFSFRALLTSRMTPPNRSPYIIFDISSPYGSTPTNSDQDYQLRDLGYIYSRLGFKFYTHFVLYDAINGCHILVAEDGFWMLKGQHSSDERVFKLKALRIGDISGVVDQEESYDGSGALERYRSVSRSGDMCSGWDDRYLNIADDMNYLDIGSLKSTWEAVFCPGCSLRKFGFGVGS